MVKVENIEMVNKPKIILSDNLQKEMLKFFMKTSIPRLAKIKRECVENKFLSQEEGQDLK